MLEDFLPPDEEVVKSAKAKLKMFEQRWRRDIAVIALLKVLSACALGVQFYFLATLLTRLPSRGNIWPDILNVLFLLLVMGLIRVAFNYFTDLRAGNLFEKSVDTFRLAIIRGLQNEPVGVPQNGFKSSQSIGFIEHTEVIAPYFSRYVPQVLACKILPFLTIIYIAYINWVAGLIVLLTLPVIPVFMIMIGRGTEAKSREQWDNMSKMGGYFLDRLKGITTLFLFDRLRGEIKPIARSANEYTGSVLEVLKIAFLSGAVLDFFSTISIAAVAIYTGLNLVNFIHLGPSNAFTLQKSLLLLLLVPELFATLKTLGNYYHDRSQAIGAVMYLQKNGIFKNGQVDIHPIKVHAVPSEANAHKGHMASNVQHAWPPEIRFEGVDFYYKDDQYIFNNFNLVINPGDKIKITGVNGSGKTSLLSLLMRWNSPISGAITFNGVSIAHLTEKHLYDQICWIGQRVTIFQGDIRSNILMGGYLPDEEIYRKILVQVSLTDFITKLPLGLDTLLAEDAKSISGGERQKMALARALVKNSKIILLDEPLTNLDNASATEFLKVLHKNTKEKTVIITGHGPRYDSLKGYLEINLKNNAKANSCCL